MSAIGRILEGFVSSLASCFLGTYRCQNVEISWTKVEENNVRLSRINGMDLDSAQSSRSSIRRVKSGKENSQRNTFEWKENVKANFINIVTKGVDRIWVKRGICCGYLLMR
jgi:hypothetical protein